MYLFFDTETADLPERWDAPVTDLDNWPRIVQLAWVTADAQEDASPPQVHLIRPDGFVISASARQVHGISTEYAAAHGVPLRPVLEQFSLAVERAQTLVAHNVDFDAHIVGAELLRAGMPNVLQNKTLRCTMRESVDFCKLPGPRGYKWPTLAELHRRLFGKPFADAHDAAADCLACMRCFFALRERKAI
jgi:DNA polymerase III subunit epsilon